LVQRRGFLKLAAGAASAMTLAACGEVAKPSAAPAISSAATGASSASTKQADIGVLNGAIDIEHQAIWTYNAAAGTKLLQKPVLDVALLFKGQHEQHRDALADAVTKLGGTPTESKAQYELPDLKSQNDILSFALRLEDTAAKAYVDAVGKLNDRALAKSAASVGTVEGEHAAILREALGQPAVPAAFVA
jgi:rubrerythrin